MFVRLKQFSQSVSHRTKPANGWTKTKLWNKKNRLKQKRADFINLTSYIIQIKIFVEQFTQIAIFSNRFRLQNKIKPERQEGRILWILFKQNPVLGKRCSHWIYFTWNRFGSSASVIPIRYRHRKIWIGRKMNHNLWHKLIQRPTAA